MARYAAATEVSSDRSRAEIEQTVRRYGAQGFLYAFNPDKAIVEFLLRNRRLRFVLDMPDYNDRQFTHTSLKGLRRDAAGHKAIYDQAVRQRWRALLLVIKAKLESVESGIVQFDAEFLAHIVLPNGQTVGEAVVPNIERIYELGEVDTDLLALPKGGNA